MTNSSAQIASPPQFLVRADLGTLLRELHKRGYTVVGPTIRQGAIVYDRLESVDDLPRGWTDRQEAGTYRLERRADERYFGYVVGPQSWKTISLSSRCDGGDSRGHSRWLEYDRRRWTRCATIRFLSECGLASWLPSPSRPCFHTKELCRSHLQARRERALLIAVNCTQAHQHAFVIQPKQVRVAHRDLTWP